MTVSLSVKGFLHSENWCEDGEEYDYSRTQKEALLTGCDHYTVCFGIKSEL